MALEPCPVCGVRSGEMTCPRCGASKGPSPFDADDDSSKPADKQAANQGPAVTGCSVVVLAVLVVVLVVAFGGGGDDDGEPEALTPDEKWERDCFSAWNGSHRNFVEAVRQQLKSPSSFEHVRTRFSTGDFPRTIRMEFDADNAFGASLRGTAVGTSTRHCAVEVLLIE